MDRRPCVRYSSGSAIAYTHALHGRRTFVSVAALLADGVLDHYETETNARMRHEPSASLQLHTRCIEGRTKRKRRRNDGPGRRCTEYRIDAPLSASTDRLRRRHECDNVAGLGACFDSMIYTVYLSISSSSVLSFAPVSRARCIQPSV